MQTAFNYDRTPRHVHLCAFNASLFTGKERDAESGNDYFGARFYSSNMGRFMSPDWADKPEDVPYAELMNPQSLNLYGYVGNNPLSSVDKDGHCCYDYVAGTVGGILNIVPNTVNLINDVTNAAISPFTSFRFDHLDTIQPDANASAAGIATGEALQMVVAIGDVGKGGQLFEDAGKVEAGLSAGTDRAAQREAMRQEGIPTSQQPIHKK